MSSTVKSSIINVSKLLITELILAKSVNKLIIGLPKVKFLNTILTILLLCFKVNINRSNTFFSNFIVSKYIVFISFKCCGWSFTFSFNNLTISVLLSTVGLVLTRLVSFIHGFCSQSTGDELFPKETSLGGLVLIPSMIIRGGLENTNDDNAFFTDGNILLYVFKI